MAIIVVESWLWQRKTKQNKQNANLIKKRSKLKYIHIVYAQWKVHNYMFVINYSFILIQIGQMQPSVIYVMSVIVLYPIQWLIYYLMMSMYFARNVYLVSTFRDLPNLNLDLPISKINLLTVLYLSVDRYLVTNNTMTIIRGHVQYITFITALHSIQHQSVLFKTNAVCIFNSNIHWQALLNNSYALCGHSGRQTSVHELIHILVMVAGFEGTHSCVHIIGFLLIYVYTAFKLVE